MTMAVNIAAMVLFMTISACFVWSVTAQVQTDLCPMNCAERTCTDPHNGDLYCTHGCIDGYWGAKHVCKHQCPSGCAICTNRHICTTCRSGYYLANNYCHECHPQCNNCNTDCTACNPGYFLQDSDCVRCPKRCSQCDSDKRCTECSSAFYTGDLCENCIDGHFGGYCHLGESDVCSENCVNRTCKLTAGWDYRFCTYGCNAGFWGNKCFNECPTQCLTCANDYGVSKECVTCPDGFYIANNDCMECHPQCTNCYSDCTSCNPGFYLDDAKCIPCPQRCSQCISDKQCTECASDHYEGEVCAGCVTGRFGETCDAVQSDSCPDTCVKQTCRLSNLRCAENCLDEHWGKTCSEKCPTNCLTCHRQFGGEWGERVCYTCKEGFYNTYSHKECTLSCHPQCSDCNTGCTACNPGFYLDNSLCLQCRSGCSECTSDTECTSCIPGFYLDNSDCLQCAQECSECATDSVCTACIDGFYLDNSECIKCPQRCSQCTSDVDCTECSSTYYTGSVCESCVGDRFGDMCESVQSERCPENCLDRTCADPDKSLLKCTFGCLDGYWGSECDGECPPTCTTCDRAFDTNPQCYRCADGHYLTETSKTCTLQCSLGCSRCISDKDCTVCKPRYYKTNSECRPCPSTCTSCTDGAACPDCIPNFTGDACENCIDGRFGPRCDSYCRHQCRSCTDRDVCQACNAGFYKGASVTNCTLTSSICPDTCETCLSRTECDACKSGYYNTDDVQDCSNVCPELCLECNHNVYGTKCLSCKDGLHGDACSESCSENCKNGVCNISNGICVHGCNDGFMGERCNGCPTGKFGIACTQDCSGNCNNNACNKAGTACLEGCKPGFTGQKCTKGDDEQTSLWPIVGAVVGGIVGVVVIVMLVLIFMKYRRLEQSRERERSVTQAEERTQHSYEDLNIADPPNSDMTYDRLDQEPPTSRNVLRIDASDSHQYVNTEI